MEKKCVYCEKTNKHEHLLIMFRDRILEDGEFEANLNNITPVNAGQSDIRKYEIKHGKNIIGYAGTLINEMEMTDEAKKLGYNYEIYKFIN